MWPKIKNAIIFLSIALVLVLGYVFLFNKDEPKDNLVSSLAVVPNATTNTGGVLPATDQDFLPLLLNVKNIRLDDGIFSDPAFMSLTDSSIILTPEGNEGRPNPFAPLGSENTPPSTSGSSTTPTLLKTNPTKTN